MSGTCLGEIFICCCYSSTQLCLGAARLCFANIGPSIWYHIRERKVGWHVAAAMKLIWHFTSPCLDCVSPPIASKKCSPFFVLILSGFYVQSDLSPTVLSPLQNFNVSPCGRGTIFSQMGHGHAEGSFAELPPAQARRGSRFI